MWSGGRLVPGVRSPRRRAAAIAAEAPTRPPITNERARPRRSSPSMGRLYEVLIATIGDLMLDVIVRLEQPLAAGDDVRARTRTGAGGQAANVAAWAASLGADARCIAKRGADATGQLVAGELATHGVQLVGPVGADATGVVVSVVGADGDRSMALRTAASRRPSHRTSSIRRGSTAMCSTSPATRCCASRSARPRSSRRGLARERGARVSVDVAAWTEIRAFGPVKFRELLDAIAPDVLFATEAEWEMLGLGAPPAKPATPGRKTGRLRQPGGGAYLTAPVGVIKRGPRGCTVVTEDARLDLAPVAAEVIDTTGAGDALARGLSPRRLVGGGGAARSRGGGSLRRESRLDAVRIAEEVRAAVASGGAVVALETTLVAHGFPAGEGVEVGAASERQVRASGAVPATIGVLDGEVVVGLDAATISTLRRAGRGPQARAARSRRVRRAGRSRRDDRRRHARGLPAGGHPRDGDRRPRRSPPRLRHERPTSRPISASSPGRPCSSSPPG